MQYERLRLINYRNYRDVVLSFSPRLNVFVGENGQGKTNILEALYLVSQGSSFRYADNSTLISTNKDQALIQTLIRENDLLFHLKMSLTKSKKNLVLNDKKVASSDIRKIFATVVFSPESLSAIKEASEQRRNLVDEFLITFDQKNAYLLSDFKKALKVRNKILKNNFEGKADRILTLALLESIQPQYVRLAIELTYNRIKALQGIKTDFNNAMQYISGNNVSELSVEYQISSINSLEYSKEQIEMSLLKRHSELIDAELSQGTTLVGPHKHDVIFLYGQKDSRFFCSQGQQRAIILSFKMAQIVYHRKAHGSYPVLMLDDVLSELDKTKRDALITFLHEIKTQIFVTTTDFNLPQSFSLDQISVKSIKDGHILD